MTFSHGTSYLLYCSERQSAILDHFHGSAMNIEPATYNRLSQAIANVFGQIENPTAPKMTRALGIDYLLLRSSYVPLTLPNGFVRAYQNQEYTVLGLRK